MEIFFHLDFGSVPAIQLVSNVYPCQLPDAGYFLGAFCFEHLTNGPHVDKEGLTPCGSEGPFWVIICHHGCKILAVSVGLDHNLWYGSCLSFSQIRHVRKGTG